MAESYVVKSHKHPIDCLHFLNWMIRVKENRIFILISSMLSVVLWITFKYFYYYPNIIFDSYYYVWAAAFNDDVSAWPIGYSKFLRLIGIFTHSVNAVLIIQYIFLQISFLLFFFSLRYFFRIERKTSFVFLILFLLNPIYLFTCNLILSDILFLGLSLLWITSLLWILFRPLKWLLIFHGLLLFLTFSIRHSATFYPIISCIGIMMSQYKLLLKIGGIALQLFIVGAFVLYTTHKNEEVYGVNQFSPLQSWKVASNALYMYEHVTDQEVKPVPLKFKSLDSMVREYYHSKHDSVNLFNPDPSWGSYYIFMYPSPLLRYKDEKYPKNKRFLIDVPVFSKMAPLYDAYGSWLIKQYPLMYTKSFVIPNIWIYMVPYPEVYYDSHNPFRLQSDTIGKVTRKWFGLRTIAIPKKYIDFRSKLFEIYPYYNTCVHLLFVLVMITFFALNGARIMVKPYLKGIFLVTILWCCNFLFIILASASLLRYQLFIVILELAFFIVLWDFLFRDENNSHPLHVKNN